MLLVRYYCAHARSRALPSRQRLAAMSAGVVELTGRACRQAGRQQRDIAAQWACRVEKSVYSARAKHGKFIAAGQAVRVDAVEFGELIVAEVEA